MAEKKVFVKKDFQVNYVDDHGNEMTATVNFNTDYLINGIACTLKAINEVDGKTILKPAIIMTSGDMFTMRPATEEDNIPLDEVTSIVEAGSSYEKNTTRVNRDELEKHEYFTFHFDTDKYVSKYKISIRKGEFVALAVQNSNTDSPRKTISLYGEIEDVDNDVIIFKRYISSRGGIRSIHKINVDVDKLVGIYRFTLDVFPLIQIKDEEASEEA